MKANNAQNDRRRSAENHYQNHRATYPRPTRFEIQLNRFFYRFFGALAVFILFSAIYEHAWHQLLTAALTGVMAWVIYDESKKKQR